MPDYLDGATGGVHMPPKDPDAVVDYDFDWTSWLQAPEVIASFVIVAATGIVVDSSQNLTPKVRVWLSGGTPGIEYSVACKITTDSVPARVDERTMIIQVDER